MREIVWALFDQIYSYITNQSYKWTIWKFPYNHLNSEGNRIPINKISDISTIQLATTETVIRQNLLYHMVFLHLQSYPLLYPTQWKDKVLIALRWQILKISLIKL